MCLNALLLYCHNTSFVYLLQIYVQGIYVVPPASGPAATLEQRKSHNPAEPPREMQSSPIQALFPT